MTDKIAFLFLTRGEHNNINLWEKFFEKADPAKFKIIIHPKDTTLLKSPLWNSPNSAILRPIPTAWGSITLVKATLYLMQMALMDPLVKKFILLSESCIPTNNFNPLYEICMLENGRSRINWTFGKNIDRYTMIKSALPPTITPHNWIKQSQWMSLDRKHVQILFQPNLQARCTQFLQHFQYCPVPDEHFFINYFIHILKIHPNEFINHPITFVDWNSNSKHPKLFAFLPTDIIQFCRDNKIFFARKFTPLQLTSNDINYILDIKETVNIEPEIKPQPKQVEPDSESEEDDEPIQPEQKPEPVQESESDSESEIENEPEPEPEPVLSTEEKEVFDFFSGSSKELKHKIVQLTKQQLNAIHSALFHKQPPQLIVESESDSDSEEVEPVIQLSVIAEEPEDLDDLDEPEPVLEQEKEPELEVQEVKEVETEVSVEVEAVTEELEKVEEHNKEDEEDEQEVLEKIEEQVKEVKEVEIEVEIEKPEEVKVDEKIKVEDEQELELELELEVQEVKEEKTLELESEKEENHLDEIEIPIQSDDKPEKVEQIEQIEKVEEPVKNTVDEIIKVVQSKYQNNKKGKMNGKKGGHF